jgi:GDPmannose 4,6-dehydratase
VTRKISRAVARISAGLQDKLYLGNLDAVRDWGYAPEYVEAMWLMLQHDEPLDLVIATGQSNTVKDFVELAFSEVGLEWQKYVDLDPRYLRPTEVESLIGDASLAQATINWQHSVRIQSLAQLMVSYDILGLENEEVSSVDKVGWRL